MNVYKKFLKQMVINYIFGTLIAVFVVGGAFLLTAVDVAPEEKKQLLMILSLSVMIMFLLEGSVFWYHLKPIRKIFSKEAPTNDEVEDALMQLHRFPKLTIKRIMIPHFLGLSVPAACISFFLVIGGKLNFPVYFVFIAIICAFLISCLHALIEFYLTIQQIQTLSLYIKTTYQTQSTFLFTDLQPTVTIKVKFQITVLLIGVFPLLLFTLATRVKLYQDSQVDNSMFFQWLGVILLMAIGFAVFTARLMAKDIEKPISQLEKMVKDVQNQQYRYINDNVYTDEFSQLVSGYNLMIRAIKQREKQNQALLESFMTSLSIALDARDPYTSGHSLRVGSYSYEIGRKLHMDKQQLRLLYQSALLHDIGKIGVPDRVLQKEGKLTEEEFAYIKEHPVIGENIIKQVQPATEVEHLLPGIRSHHERIDGKGYPDGLKGEEIPYFGRIIAVADAFDAMTSDRPYRKGMSIEKALTILQSGKGTQWDSHMVDVFIEIIKDKQRFSHEHMQDELRLIK